MSLRGSNGRGRATGRGRGRGRGKTILWEWDSYVPGPEVYEQLWHVRKAPAKVTPRLPHDSPILDTRTRILDRRQTEGLIQRNFYVVEVLYLPSNNASRSSSETPPVTGTNRVEHVEVDMSRILDYVSPEELENFENEQFRLESEAEAIALRADAEDRARRWREKNAKLAVVGRGDKPDKPRLFSGSPARGRPRGRRRGRGRGSWRGRGSMALFTRPHDDEEVEDELNDDPIESSHLAHAGLQRVIAETESEEEFEQFEPTTSPGLMRSSFVVNSALHVSPPVPWQLSTSLVQRRAVESPVIEDSDIESEGVVAPSVSSAALQLLGEDGDRERVISESDDELLGGMNRRSKRQRSDSIALDEGLLMLNPDYHHEYDQALLFRNRSSLPDAESSLPEIPAPSSSDGSILETSTPASARVIEETQDAGLEYAEDDTIHVQPIPHSSLEHQPLFDDDVEIDLDTIHADAEEYVVESILEHYHDNNGKKFYLVKWQGYEDSHDWLSHEELDGAQELVAEYNRRVQQQKKKVKARMFPSQK
ncbi:hypothetical protein ACN47E_001087 [Coniothyrium glycines]